MSMIILLTTTLPLEEECPFIAHKLFPQVVWVVLNCKAVLFLENKITEPFDYACIAQDLCIKNGRLFN